MSHSVPEAPAVPARPASTVCVMRPGAVGPEVLMVQRTRRASFMGGAYVFPGGAVDDVDRSDLAAAVIAAEGGEMLPWLSAAVREAAEEANVWITTAPPTDLQREQWAPLHGEELYRAVGATGVRFDGAGLLFFANWVTPSPVPKRFDTRFFMAWVAAATEAVPDLSEVDAAVWVRPADALSYAEDGTWAVPFPTRRTLQLLERFDSPQAAAGFVEGLGEVPRIEPKVVLAADGTPQVVVPGEDGYHDVSAELGGSS